MLLTNGNLTQKVLRGPHSLVSWKIWGFWRNVDLGCNLNSDISSYVILNYSTLSKFNFLISNIVVISISKVNGRLKEGKECEYTEY